MSDTMEEGVIVAWHKKVGDEVEAGDVLAEVETDKATMELESYFDGTLLHIGVEEGDSVPIDAVMAVIGEEGEDFEEDLKAAEKEAKSSGDSDEESDKEDKEDDSEATSSDSSKEEDKKENKGDSDDSRVKASPLAKKMAEEKGIDLAEVKGSGDHGRIVKRDIEKHEPKETEAAETTRAAEVPVDAPAPTAGGEKLYEDIKVSQMRKTIAKRLGQSKFTAPHFYLNISIKMDKAFKIRKEINELAEHKVSFNDMVIKSAAAALSKHPEINASWLGDKIRRYHEVNVGVAVAVDEGLVVPVIRNANHKGMATIAQEVKQYAEKAHDKALQSEEMQGNTFTISNLGMFGIDDFTAIINTPESCILAVGAIKDTPIVEKGEVKVAKMMKVTLSCDHRVVDGAMGAKFLQTLKQNLENPLMLLA